MLQAFVIVLREGFEAFLIVSVIAAYLAKVGHRALLPAVWWGVALSLALSAGLGWALAQRGFDPLWEGILGLAAVAFVSTLVIQMWRHARQFKRETEARLGQIAARPSSAWAARGVFVFTVLMISREGIETALMLVQVKDPAFLAGVWLGIGATALLALLWVRASHLINLRLFFQVTSVFLLLFVGQILFAALHELSEAGVLPASEAFHLATEPYAPDGIYGRWFAIASVAVCAGWLLAGWLRQRLRKPAGAASDLPARKHRNKEAVV
jgi:high-affinity iron transporter